MPFKWVKCIACDGKKYVYPKSPVTGKRIKMVCTACSGVGQVYVNQPEKKRKK